MKGSIEERKQIIDILLRVNDAGLNLGSSGNASLRVDGGLVISPSGVAYESMTPESIVFMDDDARYYGDFIPTSEWHFHTEILRTRPKFNAVLHAHCPWAMVVACCGHDLPAVHYMIGVAETDVIKCAPYEPFGTKELSTVTLEAMGSGKACLLGNHGMVTAGASLEEAFKIMAELEQLCRIYVLSQSLGGANIVAGEAMDDIFKRFKRYGKQPHELEEGEEPAFILPEKGQ